MAAIKPSKRDEYLHAADRCLEVARTLRNRKDLVRKRLQAAEWLRLANLQNKAAD